MPCYDPPATPSELADMRVRAAARGDWQSWYSLTPRRNLEEWLCDMLRGAPPHDDLLQWWQVHRKLEAKREQVT